MISDRRFLRRRESFVGHGPTICFVALAPLDAMRSTTLARYERWALSWGFGRVLAVNVHPLLTDARCSGLSDWLASPDEREAVLNRDEVLAAAAESVAVIACWGGGVRSESPARDALLASAVPLLCLGTNVDGSLRHPSFRGFPSVPRLLPWLRPASRLESCA
jgi:hypothetical protein